MGQNVLYDFSIMDGRHGSSASAQEDGGGVVDLEDASSTVSDHPVICVKVVDRAAKSR
jgi:hypothetical protein